MDTDVVEPYRPEPSDEHTPVGAPAAEPVPGAPEATIDEVDRLLDEVEAALTRLDEGTYGTCSGCGAPIDDARLAERPSTPTCARCDGAAVSGG